MTVETEERDGDLIDERDPLDWRIASGWLVVTGVWWTATWSLSVLAKQPAGFMSPWPWRFTALGFIAWALVTSWSSNVNRLARQWAPELAMGACVLAAAATAAFSLTLSSAVLWLVIGTAAFVIAAIALFRVRRHPLRSLGLLGGYLVVVLLFLPLLNVPASEVGLKVRLAIVESRYRAAGERLLHSEDTESTREGPVQDQRIPPDSGRVVLGANGEPQLVVWTWTSGLAIAHPSALVFDPNRRLGEDRDAFYQPPPNGIRLSQCEQVRGDWWWCVLYD
jgi:hypothetical protein